jgi:hypothetical protein
MPAEPDSICISPAARLFIVAAAVFVASAGGSLFFLCEQTSQYFAWTIKPPLTAAFLGAGYLAVTTALVVGLREREWPRIRVGVWVVATGLVSILIATLIHLDRFHLQSPVWTARAWAWTWLILYVGLVPGLIAALWYQRRERGTEPSSRAPLAPWLRSGMWLLGAVMLAIGAGLFFLPGPVASLWPWSLTPLTARMVGAFYVAFAVSLFAAAKENDYTRILVATAAYVVFAVLQLVNLVRYPVVDWQQPHGWLLAAVLTALFVFGAAGVRSYLALRNKKPHADPDPVH